MTNVIGCPHFDSFFTTNTPQQQQQQDEPSINNKFEQIFNFIAERRQNINNKPSINDKIDHVNQTKIAKTKLPTCQECSNLNDLYICVDCLFIGCRPQASPTINDLSSSHIIKHCQDNIHLIIIDLVYGATYCSVCRDIQYDPRCEEIKRKCFKQKLLPHGTKLIQFLK
jgi:hypothetical protein